MSVKRVRTSTCCMYSYFKEITVFLGGPFLEEVIQPQKETHKIL